MKKGGGVGVAVGADMDRVGVGPTRREKEQRKW